MINNLNNNRKMNNSIVTAVTTKSKLHLTVNKSVLTQHQQQVSHQQLEEKLHHQQLLTPQDSKPNQLRVGAVKPSFSLFSIRMSK
jgi:hypothetical protein